MRLRRFFLENPERLLPRRNHEADDGRNNNKLRKPDGSKHGGRNCTTGSVIKAWRNQTRSSTPSRAHSISCYPVSHDELKKRMESYKREAARNPKRGSIGFYPGLLTVGKEVSANLPIHHEVLVVERLPRPILYPKQLHTKSVYTLNQDGSKPMSKRINVMLPEATIHILNRLTTQGSRSRFISDAVLHYVHSRGKESLRDRLKVGYQADAAENLKIAMEWFPVEEQAWQKATRAGKK